MNLRRLNMLALLAGVAMVLAGASTSLAATTYTYGNYSGPNFDFIDMRETVQSSDDETAPLFEAPSPSGDNLFFTPSSFIADSANGDGGAGTGALDITHSTFFTSIESNGPGFIDSIILNEGGDIVLSDLPPGAGGPATGVQAFMAGTVTITDSINPGDIGTILTFGSGGDFDVCFQVGGGPCSTSLYLGLPSSSSSWTATVTIAIDSILSGVTGVNLAWDNDLRANSQDLEPDASTSSSIQKKAAFTGITVIPEPATALLVGMGLIGLASHGRRRARG